MNVLGLFSGIGGFELGLQRAGMRIAAMCEIDQFCRRVLAKHWPEVPVYDDVRILTAERLQADGIAVDVICGGFPCQDISTAGRGAGITGERSGLWREYARLVGEIRPRFVIVENVAALLGRGLGDVLGDLAALGLDAEWHSIPASALGAPHRRDRVWIVAYARCGRLKSGQHQETESISNAATSGHDLAHPSELHRDGGGRQFDRGHLYGPKLAALIRDSRWEPEPDVGRVANGVPARVDRLRSLGNAVVPQIPEIIGRAILASAS